MSRPLVDFVDTDALAAVDRRVAGSPVPVSCRTLAEDPDTGGASVVVDIPAGWRGPAGRWRADLELMVICGALRLGERRLLRLGYLFVPAGVALPPASTDVDTRVLAFTSAASLEPAAAPALGQDWTGRCVGPLQLSDLEWEQPRTPGLSLTGAWP